MKSAVLLFASSVLLEREVADKYPWPVLNVFKAFDEAKNLVRDQGRAAANVYFDLGLLASEQKAALDTDPYAYGFKANRRVWTPSRNSHSNRVSRRESSNSTKYFILQRSIFEFGTTSPAATFRTPRL